jgi:hypothetical protein
MWPYWMIYLTLAFPAMLAQHPVKESRLFMWLAAGFLLTLFIGFRHEVGGDWGGYLGHFLIANYFSFTETILRSDPGYALLNWWVSGQGFEIYTVNLICGVIFTTGLIAFARRQPYPWLALAVAFPYLIIVLGMGYTRQGVALGFIFLSLNALEYHQFKRYLTYIALATLFHKTALIMIPLGFFIWGKGWVFRAIAVVVAAYVLFDALVAESTEDLWRNYVDTQMLSQGAQIRVLMNLVPSLILLAFWKTWRTLFPNYWFWFWIAAGSVAAVILVGFASTAVDRIALYFIPIQVVVFSRLPFLLRKQISPETVTVGIVLGYALVLYVWLNYASHAYYWIPYQNMLFL